MLRHIFWMTACLLPTATVAGTISGGGGALRRYEANPWFLENTDVVLYCVEQDTRTFKLDPEIAKTHISEAFAFWKDYFRRWERDFPASERKFRVATQTFVAQDRCSEATDLRFQLGTLSQAQRSLLGEPSQWAGAAVLEHYDMRQLKARGFIYLGADTGSDAMRSSNPVAELPWQPCGGLTFKQVVVHELGHVFGLQHDEMSWIMTDGAPETSVSKAYVGALNTDTDGSICDGERRLSERDRYYLRNLTPGSTFSIYSQTFSPSVMTGTLQASADWRNLVIDTGEGSFVLSGNVSTSEGVVVTLPPEHADYAAGRWYGGYRKISNGTWNGVLRSSDGSLPVHAYTSGFEPLSFAIFDPTKQIFHNGFLSQMF